MQLSKVNSRIAKQITVLIAVSMLSQIYLSTVLVLNSQNLQQTNWLSSLFTDKVLICSDNGMQWVSVSEIIAHNKARLGVTEQDKSEQPKQLDCPLLKAFKYPVLLFAILLSLFQLWLKPPVSIFNKYSFQPCWKKLTVQLAPKQSPPFFWYGPNN